MSSRPEFDLHFYFDPVCPFAWMTSKWVRMVAAQRDYRVDWRFISLRILNANVDYASHFPPEYEDGHTAGLRLLRVAARVRSEHGRRRGRTALLGDRRPHFRHATRRRSAVGVAEPAARGASLEPLLRDAGLPTDLADALDDAAFDDEIRAETEEALALTGRDVGTPILHFQPPGGTAFFGPVISRLPSADDAGPLWDHVIALGGVSRLRRDQAQPAGAAPAGQLRRRHRIGWQAKRIGTAVAVGSRSSLRIALRGKSVDMTERRWIRNSKTARAAAEVLRARPHLDLPADQRRVWAPACSGFPRHW